MKYEILRYLIFDPLFMEASLNTNGHISFIAMSNHQ